MLILPLLLCCSKVQSQTVVFTVSYDSITVVQPGVVNFGDSVNFTFTVGNIGTVPFNGSLLIMRRKDSTLTYQIDSITGVNIPVNGTIPVFTQDSVSSARYDGGINILVIWPTATMPGVAITTIDTVRGDVWVNTSTAAGEGSLSKGTTLYPNPATNAFRLDLGDPNKVPTQLVLLNAQGEIVRQWSDPNQRFDVSDLPTGMYYLQVHYSNGMTEHKPFIVLH